MATLTNNEIEQLQQQFKEKTEELRAIYDKLAEAGAVPVPDDILDSVAGGYHPLSPSYVPAYTSVGSKTQKRL